MSQVNITLELESDEQTKSVSMVLITTFFISRALSPGPLTPQTSCWAKFPSDLKCVCGIWVQ